MTVEPRPSVASGRPCPVTELPAGDAPSLELFLGDAEFTVDSGGPLLVRGHGVTHGELVRFHEKDTVGGKDVRVWHVSQRDGGFVAEPLAAF